MISRARHSTVRASGGRGSSAPTSSRDVTNELPPYRKPSHPLDLEAIRSLRDLQGRSLNDIITHNKQATRAIIDNAENVHEMLQDHTAYLERRQKKWHAGKSLEDKEDEEHNMEQLRSQVDKATANLEESMRAVIDSGVAAQRIDGTLDWLRTDAPRQLDAEYQTQMTQRATQRQSQSQIRSQQRRDQDADSDEDETMADAPTPGPTPLDGSRIALTGATEMFTTRMQREKDSYTSLSYTTRYAQNNDYKEFKVAIHDAKYGGDGPELGHPDTWFTESGSPAPGITDNTQQGAFDDDDDIMVDKEMISTKCAITFQQFKDPITSTRCPHTFEKSAIMDMIRAGTQRVNGERAVMCPVSGCSQLLTANDVRSDPLIVRKIRRKQQAEAKAAEAAAEESSDEDDEGPRRNIGMIDSDHDDPNSSSRIQVPSSQQPPRSTMIEDLGDPSDDDE